MWPKMREPRRPPTHARHTPCTQSPQLHLPARERAPRAAKARSGHTETECCRGSDCSHRSRARDCEPLWFAPALGRGRGEEAVGLCADQKASGWGRRYYFLPHGRIVVISEHSASRPREARRRRCLRQRRTRLRALLSPRQCSMLVFAILNLRGRAGLCERAWRLRERRLNKPCRDPPSQVNTDEHRVCG